MRSFGQVVNYLRTPFHRETVFQNKNEYRKIVTNRGVLIGGVSVGDWGEYLPALETFQQSRKISFYQRWLFKFNGRLFVRKVNDDVTQWAPSAIVCQCNGITQGALMASVQGGCKTVCQIGKETRAGTVCGSCKPLLVQLLEKATGLTVEKTKEWAWAPMLVASVIALFIAAIVLLIPGLEVGSSVTKPAPFEFLWNDKYWKQVTGFTLLGLSVVGLLMSLRKRINIKHFGEFAHWRMVHIGLGVISASMLFFHSGLHLGENLNRLLMLDFLLVIALGSLAGLVVSLSHRLPAKNAPVSYTHLTLPTIYSV